MSYKLFVFFYSVSLFAMEELPSSKKIRWNPTKAKSFRNELKDKKQAKRTKNSPNKQAISTHTRVKNPRNEIKNQEKSKRNKKQTQAIKKRVPRSAYDNFLNSCFTTQLLCNFVAEQETSGDITTLGLLYLMSPYFPDELKNHIASYLFDDLDPIQFFYRHQNFPSTRLITTHGKNRFHVKRLPDNQVQIHCNMKGRHVCQIGKNLSFNVAQNPKYYVAFNQPKLDQKYNPRTLRSCAPIFKNLLKKLNAGLEILIKEDEGNYITADSKREVRRWIPDCSALINKFKLHATVEDYLVLKESTGGADFFKNSPQKNKYCEITQRIDNAHEEFLEQDKKNLQREFDEH